VRKILGEGAALIPSSKKRGGMGTILNIPLGHKNAAFVRSHFDGMEVQINEARAPMKSWWPPRSRIAAARCRGSVV
jgi:hypothetical protein